jgi:PAT family beta-lactamase induction signal transducer AmpG
MMLPGMVSGELQKLVGYRMFFWIVMALCSVTFVVAWFIKVDPEFGKKQEDE